MNATSIDCSAMRVAIPLIEGLLHELQRAGQSLSGVDIPSGVPAQVRGYVNQVITSAERALRDAHRQVSPIPADLQRRVSAAQLVDQPWVIAASGGLQALGIFAGSFTINDLDRWKAAGHAGRDLFAGIRAGDRYPNGFWSEFRTMKAAAQDAVRTQGVPKYLANGAKVAERAIPIAGAGLTAYSNLRNPYLSTSQKIGRTAASVAIGAGVSAASGLAAGAAFGLAAGPPGFLIGAGAGLAWSVLDSKFGISNRVGDAVADAIDAGADVAKDVGEGVSEAADAAKDAIGSIF